MELGISKTQWTTSGVSVNEQYEWRQERNELVGHRATSSVQVTVGDLTQLGPILSRSVGEAKAQVAGPHWRVDDDNPAVLAVLRAAALDARRRAEADAMALGLRVGEVEAISEQPFGADRPPLRPEAMRARGFAKADAADDVPVNPGEVELGVDVHVRLALIPRA